MKIYMSAGHHDNPLHRKSLKIFLSNLNKKNGIPKFIAVEANEVLFKAVIENQRNHFVKLAREDNVLQKIHRVLLRNLAKAISYEADTHADVFTTEVNTVWLDNVQRDFSRICDPCKMAKNYRDRCRLAVLDAKLSLTPDLREPQLFEAVDAFLERELETSQNRATSPATGAYDRDKAWMKLLQDYLWDSGPSDYGIVVVGSDHAQNKPDYIRYLLSKAGHDCEVFLLNSQPQQRAEQGCAERTPRTF